MPYAVFLAAKEIEIAANSQELLHRINKFVGPDYEYEPRFKLNWDLYNDHQPTEEFKLKFDLWVYVLNIMHFSQKNLFISCLVLQIYRQAAKNAVNSLKELDVSGSLGLPKSEAHKT